MIAQSLAVLRAEAPVLAGSAAVVLVMVAAAYLLGFRARTRIDEAMLERLAAAEGAQLQASVIAANGRTALARLSDGRFLVVRAMGADVSARAAAVNSLTLRRNGARLSVRFADLGFPPLDMELQDTPSWLDDVPGEAR